jgi:hypothetical protein
MNTCAVTIAANAGTWPAKDHGMSAAPDQRLGLSAAFGNELCAILHQISDATTAVIVTPFQGFGPQLLSDKTMDATVSNVSSTLL